ncbi:MAG: endonuclease/exonuclease/phosphatase family protein [Planctomycetota bacterium]
MGRELALELALFAGALVSALFGYGGQLFPPPPFEPGAREDGTLRVVTWNVGGARGGELHGLRDADAPHVASVLRALAPDVAVLQEVGSRAAADELARALGSGWEARRGAGGLTVLAREAELDRARRVRGVGRALVVELRWRGLEVALAGVHADAFDPEERNEEVGRTAERLFDERADLHLLLGDLNLDVDLDKKRDLFSSQVHLDVETYNFVADRLRDAASGRGATAEPDRRLDYVFVSRSARVEAAGPWKGQRVGTMDHDPVVADVLP